MKGALLKLAPVPLINPGEASTLEGSDKSPPTVLVSLVEAFRESAAAMAAGNVPRPCKALPGCEHDYVASKGVQLYTQG